MAVSIYTDDVPVLGQDSATFSENNQNYVYYVSNLAPEINSTVEAINTSEINAEGYANDAASFAVQASASATEANEAKSVCLTSSNIVGAWVGSSGTATKGGAYFHNSGWWGLLNDVPNIAATEPSDTNPDWGFINQGIQAVRVPIPIAPLNGASNISVTPLLEAEPYGNAFGTARAYREFQVDIGAGDFSSPIYAPTPVDEDNHNVVTPLSLSSGYKWRCRDVSVLGEVSEWMPVQSFSTGAVSIQAPTITVDGEPSEVPEQPFITSSAFVVNNGTDTHLNTIRTIRRQSDGVLVWNPGADAVNLTTIQVPQGIIQPGITYIVNVTYTGVTYGLGETGVKVVTTSSVFSVPVDDVFSTFVTIGDASVQPVVAGIDMSSDSLVVTKARTATTSWKFTDTARGVTKALSSDSVAAEVTDVNGVTAFNADGITLGSDVSYNANTVKFVHYLYKESPKFFMKRLVTHTNGVQSDIDASSLGIVGQVIIKQANGISDWPVWHKDLTAGNNLILNDAVAQSPTNAYVSVSGTTVSIGSSAPTGSYIVYMHAHDPDTTNGIIQCGSYIGNGNIDGPEINVGWEPQSVEVKAIDSAGDWDVLDNIRGITVTDDPYLNYNTSSAETINEDLVDLTATGFKIKTTSSRYNTNGVKYLYKVIRRSNKVPTSGTEVFAIDQGDGSSNPGLASGFPVDLALQRSSTTTINNINVSSRAIEAQFLLTNSTNATSPSNAWLFDFMDGWRTTGPIGSLSWMFKRATGFMDTFAYKGDGIAGRSVYHSLQSVPELIIVKSINIANPWAVYHKDNTANPETQYMILNDSSATNSGTLWNNTLPTETEFTVSSGSTVNVSGEFYIAILFASLPGVSKVGHYIGNGSSQDINCDFVAGARFVMIKRTDAVGDWFIWDSLRGITVGNDPHLSLNTTAAQVSDDSIDPLSSGFTVNEIGTNINVSSANYIFLAIA